MLSIDISSEITAPEENAANTTETLSCAEAERDGASETNATDNEDAPVQDIRDLLGEDVVLLPVKTGEKRPAISDWQKVTIEKMSDPYYIGQLKFGNVGVLLGSASGGLCAIDIDNDEAVEPFLELNPSLRETLRTKGARGCQIWIRVSGEYPALAKVKMRDGQDWGEWRANGGQSVIYGMHPSGKPYQILHETKPITIDFSTIQWPSVLKLPWIKTDFDEVTESEGQPFTVSERGTVEINQMFFVRKYTLEHSIIFDSGLGDFFQYDVTDGLWKRQSVEAIKREFLQTLRDAAEESRLKAIYHKRNDAFVGSLVSLLKVTVETRAAFANRVPAIHVDNGMICFEADDVLLKSFHPDFLSRNQCPFAYDPEAQCPRFLSELLASAIDQDDIALLQKWSGAILLGRNTAQRFLMLLGTAAGGKSTVMNVLERTIGRVNVAQMRTEHLSDKFELFGFVGKTLLTGKDVSADFLMHKGAHVLKALVGQDSLEAEKKGFNERVQLIGDFNVGITCNADLNIRLQGDAAAWRRRLLVIKYERPPVAKKIPDFADQLLREEGPGILRWMVEGAIALRENLQEVGDYKLSVKQTAEIDRLMDQSDSVRRFVQEAVFKVRRSDVTVVELTEAYYAYCEEKGWHPFGARELRSDLAKYMLEVHKANNSHDIVRGGKSTRGFRHIGLEAEVNND